MKLQESIHCSQPPGFSNVIRFLTARAQSARVMALLANRTATISYVPISEGAKGRNMSWILSDTFNGHVCGGGKAEEETSKPVSWHVGGKLLATSKSQMPVPVHMSAILAPGWRGGMFGWIRNPRVLVVKTCCSSSLGLRCEFACF